jgi:hypothetical protein
MGDLAGDMVRDVSFRNTVSQSCAEPAWNATKVAKKAAVESGEGTAGESKFRGPVMGKEGVSMLEECNQDQPVVDPEPRI